MTDSGMVHASNASYQVDRLLGRNGGQCPGIPAHIKELDSKGCRPKGFRKPSTRTTRVESAMDGFMRVCESLLADRPCLHGTFRPGIPEEPKKHPKILFEALL